ncbi:MAG: tetratricopeptide repeat protein [Opitutales bacterium]
MRLKKFPIQHLLLAAALITGGASPSTAQDASSLGFSQLQDQANALVERGRLQDALPLLKELVDRVEKGVGEAEDSDFDIDFPLFLIGTGHIQRFVANGEKDELAEALTWYDKLESAYPESPHLKDALLKKIDVLRVLGRNDDAIALMADILADEYDIRLNYSEETKLLKDITETYYSTGELEEGLPYFERLLRVTSDPEEQALAAAASFEALFAADRMDDALELLPMLALDSEVRYRPRLNIALLKASDKLVDQDRVNDAALTLNLINTTDVMIDFHESQIERKQDEIEHRESLGGSEDVIETLKQEVRSLENNLKVLRDLPTLRNELLVRRARNYTRTERRYEAFWMFHDLMVENPGHEQSEFYHYAAFSNAREINKTETMIEIGRNYRSEFPEGEYYSDVTAGLASVLVDVGNDAEFLELSENFLDQRPLDPVAPNLFARWARHLLNEGRFQDLIDQALEWKDQHNDSTYADAIEYWTGLARLQIGDYQEAAADFDTLLDRFPKSDYAEDALLRKGVSLFYAQDYEQARETLDAYVEQFPRGDALDQVYYFLGELENMAGNHELALEHFKKADELTASQDIHDGAAFRIGSVYETMERYDDMVEHFEAYIDRFGEAGRLTDAVYELGRAYEFTLRPTRMLELYRDTIRNYIDEADNAGVDTLIEAYAEKYEENRTMLTKTVAFLDKMRDDREFREKLVTDRGFLFEQFYLDQDLHQPLYNDMRFHPDFGSELVDDLSPLEDLFAVYRDELQAFPEESPEAFFRELLAEHRGRGNRIAETRALMGLYRIDVELDPQDQRFDEDLLAQATPRVILYIADYERQKRLDFAVEAWNELLERYPDDDAAIVALMRLADVSDERGEVSAALDYLETIVDRFPGSPKIPGVILRQGQILTAEGRTKEAREKYQYILRVPDWRGVVHARALFQTGEAFMADEAYAEAHGFFERTFLGYSHFGEWAARAYLADAEALLKMGEREDAVRTLEEASDSLADEAPEDLYETIRTKLRELQS